MTSSSLAVPPVAKRIAHEVVIHERAWTDEYRWLHRKNDPEVRAYLEAENTYTEAIMAPFQPFQGALYKEMLARIKETDMGVPYRMGAWWYYARTETGKQYPIYCRKWRDLEAPEHITLDLNELAAGHEYFALGAYKISPGGNLLAFSSDVTGFREYTLRIKNLATGEMLAERIEKTRSVAWAMDNQHLFYAKEDKAKRAYRIYRHVLGGRRDRILHEESDERFSVSVTRTRSDAYLVLTTASATASEVRYLDAKRPRAPWTLIEGRSDNHEYYADHAGDSFYIVSNDQGRNFRLVVAPAAHPSKENWAELIPHRPDVMLEGVDLFARHMVLHERQGGFPLLRVQSYDSRETWRVEMPDAACSVRGAGNEEFASTVYRIEYESLVVPLSGYDCDLITRELKLLKRQEVLGGYDAGQYQSELFHAKASDGTLVPVSMVYKKQERHAGPQPALLTGYGAYGIPNDVHFSSTRLSLLDRGVIYAIAHVRGGGEYGKAWHDNGRMLKKRNSFTDFIAAAEALIAQGYTRADQLLIQGGSAGGLLVCAVANFRPELFKAVIAEVPFVDVIHTMLDDTLPLTTGEYEEWGNPHERTYFEYMRAYSPYDNLAAKPYPAMLVETSLNDSQVMYWEPAKYVARLRVMNTSKRP
ncbi:MAG: S9 family peptidase, partial [Betaproteobacteria bacterium]|nr:S9 family peptidase [Betaproteobacteria bacterium]